MPYTRLTTTKNINDVISASGTWSISTGDTSQIYVLIGTATLTSSVTINADTSAGAPIDGMTYVIEYRSSITLGGNHITIFGLSLTTQQALTPGKITTTWANSQWNSEYLPDFTQTTAFIQGTQLTNPISITLANQSVPGSALMSSVAHNGLVQNGSGNLDVNVDNITIGFSSNNLIVKQNSINQNYLTTSVAGNGLTGGNGTPLAVAVDGTTIVISGNILQVPNLGITNSKINVGAPNTVKVTNNSSSYIDLSLPSGSLLGNIGSGVQAVSLVQASAGITQNIVVPVNFKYTTSTLPLQIPYNCIIISCIFTVIETIAGTDNGAIQLNNSASALMTGSNITVSSGSTPGTIASSGTISANNTILANTSLYIQASKTTVGGIGFLNIITQRI